MGKGFMDLSLFFFMILYKLRKRKIGTNKDIKLKIKNLGCNKSEKQP